MFATRLQACAEQGGRDALHLWHCLIFDCIFFKHCRQPHSAAPLQLAATAVVLDPSTQQQGTFNGELALGTETIVGEPWAQCSCAQPRCCWRWHPGARQPANTPAPGLGINPLPPSSKQDRQSTRSSRSLQGHKEVKTPPGLLSKPQLLQMPDAPPGTPGHAPECPQPS